MKAFKRWPQLLVGLLLFAVFAAALSIRIALPYGNVFTSNGIVFTGNDAYYHMRLVESLVHNFPHFPGVDPYLVLSTGGASPVVGSFFQWLLGVIIWIVGLGSPSEHTINLIGVYFPAVLGALTVVPAFFIAKELWGKHGKWAGLVAAVLVGILPGEFLGRSILGFTDQHVAETLLSTTSVLFLIMAVKSARLRELSFSDFREMRWDKILRPGIWAILSGLFLGMYIFAWQGALLVVFAMAAYFIIQFVVDHLRNRSTEYLASVGTILFLVTLIFIPVAQSNLYAPSLLIAVLIPVVLGVISYYMKERGMRRAYYPGALVVLAGAGLGLFYLIQPALLRSMFSAFNIFTPSGTLLATVEAQSIFTPLTAGGGFLDSPAWVNFYLTLPIAFLGLAILLVHSVGKQGNPEKLAFFVWCIVMMVATIGQRRFAYYFAVNVALLTGYVSVVFYYLITWGLAYTGGDHSHSLSSATFDLDGLKVTAPASEAAMPIANRKKARRRELELARRRELQRRRAQREQGKSAVMVRQYVSFGLTAVLVFLLFSQMVLFPDPAHGLTKAPAIATASSTPYAPSAGWMKALLWMRDNTPEPLGSADAYFQHYSKTQGFTYPDSAYGVTAWWDYGYWITYIGHRIPSANPGQAAGPVTLVADFLTAQDEASAEAFADQMKTGYVIMDYQAATSKFWAVATWAGKSQSDFFEVYWDPQNSQQQLYIYPAYYQSMATRLYSFNGTAQAGLNPLVVEYTVRTTAEGSYKEIVSQKQFATYEEASIYVESQTSSDFAIVGTDPLISPVPLEALQNYRPVYESESKVAISSSNQTAEIKIFERTK